MKNPVEGLVTRYKKLPKAAQIGIPVVLVAGVLLYERHKRAQETQATNDAAPDDSQAQPTDQVGASPTSQLYGPDAGYIGAGGGPLMFPSPAGNSGSAGVADPTLGTGSTGSPGDSGSSGEPGAPGSAGDPGTQGPPGDPGPTGAAPITSTSAATTAGQTPAAVNATPKHKKHPKHKPQAKPQHPTGGGQTHRKVHHTLHPNVQAHHPHAVATASHGWHPPTKPKPKKKIKPNPRGGIRNRPQKTPDEIGGIVTESGARRHRHRNAAGYYN